MPSIDHHKNKIRELAQKGLDITRANGTLTADKKSALDTIETEIQHHLSEVKSLEFVNAKRKDIFGAVGDLGGWNPNDNGGPTVKSRVPSPNYKLDADQVGALYESFKSKSSLKVELKTAYTDIDAALPPQFSGHLVPLRHEPVRVLDLLPKQAMSAPSVEVLVHSSTSGTAGVVQAGALKPLITPIVTKNIISAVKLAAMATVEDELLSDFVAFQSYLTQELEKQIIDAENNSVLNGTGLGGDMTGLLNTSGILTRAMGADTGLDALEQAIMDLRVGTSYVAPDAIIMHPTTWSKIRRSKTSQGQYLIAPDPTAPEANQLWGTPVKTTTSIAAGTALAGSFADAVEGYVREGLSVRSNYNTDDFQRNRTSFICEERLNIVAVRPSALVKVTGL